MIKTRKLTSKYQLIAMLLFLLTFASCKERVPLSTITNPETFPTRTSYNLTMVESNDGSRKYRFETPLAEEFDEATEPYLEFKKGIKVETFAADSVTIESDIVADYAHYNKTQKLWRAQGNVVAKNFLEDRTLYTDELFWDENRQLLYSNVRVKVVDKQDIHVGMGFESDQEFKRWSFNKGRGRVEVKDSLQNKDRDRDSTSIQHSDSILSVTPSTTTTPNERAQFGDSPAEKKLPTKRESTLLGDSPAKKKLPTKRESPQKQNKATEE